MTAPKSISGSFWPSHGHVDFRSNEELTRSLASVFPIDFPQRPVRVRFVSRGVEISTSIVKDEPSIAVPATDPSWIEVSWDEDGRREVARVEISPGERRLVETRATQVDVRAIAGRRFQLTQQRESKPMASTTCFVVMAFGKKTNFQSVPPRVLDLDKTYEHIIKPAATEAGLQCLRADEILHAGNIGVPDFEYLLNADVVIADISTANANTMYELGVRHAFRPYTTIVIAESELGRVFDMQHTVIRRYKHLGEDIGFVEKASECEKSWRAHSRRSLAMTQLPQTARCTVTCQICARPNRRGLYEHRNSVRPLPNPLSGCYGSESRQHRNGPTKGPCCKP
jgi:hypothetical protein